MKAAFNKMISFAFVLFGSFLLAHAELPKNSRGSSDNDLIAHGRYLVTLGGCNDCHTPGFAPSNGNVPEQGWLIGDNIGYKGPWGVTYPINLRTYMSNLTEEQWIARAKTVKTRPPMPWYAINQMPERDLRAVYKFIRSLGPSDNQTPAYVPPEQNPTSPYIVFEPQGPTP